MKKKSALVLQLEADIAAKGAEVQPLAVKSNSSQLTPEEDAKFTELVGQINELGENLAKAINQANDAEDMLKVYNQFNVPADGAKDRGVTDAEVVDIGRKAAKSLGRQFVESDEFKSYRGRKTGTSAPVKFDGMFPEYDMEQKALIYSGTGSASMVQPQVAPGIYRGNEAPLVMRDVLLNLNTTSDAVIAVSESGFTNGAVEVAEATTVSGGAKPESALTFTEVSFPVRTIAHWIPITRQMLEDLPMMQGYVDQRLRTGLLRREDNQIINGDGIAPNLTGILATVGIQDLDAAYFGGAPVNDAGQDNENINRLRRAKRVIQVTGDAQATFAVINPVDKEMFDTVSTADRQYLLSGPLAPSNSTLWGLQIVESENIVAGTAIVGDGTMAAVVDRRDAQVYIADQHSDFFIRNIFVMLAEERIAFPVFRPAAFAAVEFAAW
jgi:HK97 family phage major capsid protein